MKHLISTYNPQQLFSVIMAVKECFVSQYGIRQMLMS